MFGAASYEPIILLAHLAAATDRLQLGVSVLISPLRQQFWLLKQLGTLSALAGDRILVGLGTGWDTSEFVASGVDKHGRGRRLDADLDALLDARRLGSLSLPDGQVEPAPSQFAALLVGGGSTLTLGTNKVPVTILPSVARRIARSDGWIIRSSVPIELWAADINSIRRCREHLGRTPDCEVVLASFIHVSVAPHDRAVLDQMDVMSQIGWTSDEDLFRRVFPSGNVDEIVAWLRRATALGVTHFVFHPVGAIDQQIQLIADLILPKLKLRPEESPT